MFEKRIDCLTVGELEVNDFKIEIGALDYSFRMNGIIGLDFLRATRAILNLGDLSLLRAPAR